MGMPAKPRNVTVLPANKRAIDPKDVIDGLNADPNVVSYTVHVDKKAATTQISATDMGGQVLTQDHRAPGLFTMTVSVPTGLTTASRRKNRNKKICALYEDHTQTEIAEILGCSQSLVSNVLREKGLC
jgi:hypothetical protein